MSRRKRAAAPWVEYLIYLFLTVVGVLLILPFYFTFINSFQPENFLRLPSKWYFLPESWNFINYKEAWEYAKLGRGFRNSLFYVTIFTVASGIIAMLVGYVLAKKQFRGRKFVFILLLSTMMVPGEVLLVPNFLLVRDLGLYNSLAALIVPGLVNIMGVFIAKQFMESIPDSVLEAATIDGAGEWRVFSQVAFPMAMSAFSTNMIITFTATWNDYLWPMIVLNKSELYSVQLMIESFVSANLGNNDYFNILKDAGLIATLAPILIVYFIFQKKFVDGMAISGLK